MTARDFLRARWPAATVPHHPSRAGRISGDSP